MHDCTLVVPFISNIKKHLRILQRMQLPYILPLAGLTGIALKICNIRKTVVLGQSPEQVLHAAREICMHTLICSILNIKCILQAPLQFTGVKLGRTRLVTIIWLKALSMA